MMPGTAQAKLDSSGMNGRPDRPTPRISRSSRMRRAAGSPVFQRQNESEQDDDLRQEHQHATAGTGDNASTSRLCSTPAGVWRRPAAERGCAFLNQADGGLAQADTAWNISNSTVSNAGPSTGCMTRLSAGPATVADLPVRSRSGQQRFDACVRSFHAVAAFQRGMQRRMLDLAGGLAAPMFDQVGHAVATDGDRFHYRNTDALRQSGSIDADAALLCGIGQVPAPGSSAGPAAAIPSPAAGQAQIGGIDYRDQHIRRQLVFHLPQQHVARDLLVRRGDKQAGCRAGRSTPRRAAARQTGRALSTDYPSVVGDLGARPVRQLNSAVLPQFGLPTRQKRIGAAACIGWFPQSASMISVMILLASARRSANLVPLICTAIRSRPNRPKPITRSLAPGRKPSSFRRCVTCRHYYQTHRECR